jgi:hypothetical protein
MAAVNEVHRPVRIAEGRDTRSTGTALRVFHLLLN